MSTLTRQGTRRGSKRTYEVMGTVASIDIRDEVHPDLIAYAFRSAFDELLRIDRKFSSYRDDSELTLVSKGELLRDQASDEMNAVLDACTAMSLISHGAFDISRGCADGEIDVAGYVKGWAVDRAADILRAYKLENFCIGVGGDLVASGRPDHDRPWRVGVRDPQDHRQVRAVISLDTAAGMCAVATSGNYERGEHVWDGRGDGSLVSNAGSTTVVGPELTRTDVFATVAYAMGGRKGLAWIDDREGFEALAINGSGKLSGTPGMPALLHG
jgi:thiamine biosynthesis lipoprotein